MSAVNNFILKATNCDAVNSGLVISKVCSLKESEINKPIKSTIAYNGTKLNESEIINIELIETSTLPNKSIKQESSIDSSIQFYDQNICDVQKVLEQEQELQKQLYSGANVANGWFRVNHVGKVIYISPSGIGLTSLKQVKDYLLTQGTCKCGLPFPLRIELFFSFDINVPNVPLKTPIEGIKCDPNCLHKKKLMTSSQIGYNQVNASNNQHPQKKVNLQKQRKTNECLLPSYVTSVNKKINQSSICNNNSESTVMIVNKNNNSLATNNIQPLMMQSKNQPQQFLQQQIDPQNMSNLVNVRIVKDENDLSENSKLPPWRKNVVQGQFGNGSKCTQPSIITTSTAHGGIPIFQFNGQMIAIDQQSQQFNNQSQKIQIIEQKSADGDKMIIRRRPPTFKEDPTAYLNQQTALLHNTITTLHSPDVTTSMVSPTIQENSSEYQQRTQRHIVQQIVKTPNMPNQQFSSISGQTLTQNMSMSNAIVQIQNCDIKQQQQQTKVSIMQDQMQADQQTLRTNPKGRPPKHSRRLVSFSQESPVSSSTTNNMVKITKCNTPDTTSLSGEAITESVVQSTNNFDGSDVVKYARNSSTQELIRTSMTHVIAGKAACLTTSSSSNSSVRKPATTITSVQKKPQTIVTQMKTNSNINNNNINNNLIHHLTNNPNQQVMMTSNGQQFIVMPSSNLQTQPQNIVLNSNAIVQIQNSNPNQQRLIQTTTGQSGNIIIQTNNGNLLATAQSNPNNFIVNGQPIIFQNGQIIQSNSNLIASPKNNILLTGGAATSSSKTLFGGNNQLALGQQAVILQNSMIPQSTLVNDTTYMQNIAQQQKIMLNPEKKKGRKRKNPLSESSVHQQVTPQTNQPSNLLQISTSTNPQNFHISSPNILVQNKFSQPTTTGGQQIILQNGQTIIQQPMNFVGGQQMIPPQLMALSDGNSFVQIQNPSFNNIIASSQNMIRTTPTHQQLQPIQKTIITNNGQQYIVQSGGQLNLMNQLPFNSMGFVVQSATHHQNQQQQQILNPIVFQSQGQQIMAQPQILTHSPGHISTQLSTQQAQFLNQSDHNNKIQRKMMLQHKTQQQNSLFPQIMTKAPRTTGMPLQYASSAKNTIPALVQNVTEEHEDLEEDDDNQELVQQYEDLECEDETDELELSFDEKPDMIEELHHGTSQQILHSSSMIDGQCGIMNIDDITIEMDEINDLNEYLNAIDEEDNKISQIGLSSLQHFGNSPPDTTTHSPRSPVEIVTNVHHVFGSGSEKSNGSSESNNMVSSSELDSNVVSPECHHIIDSPLSHHHLNHPSTSQPIFKLPLEPRSSNIRSPPSYSMTTHFFDNNSRSPLRPDSHESSTYEHQHQSNNHCQNNNGDDYKSLLSSLSEDFKNDKCIISEKSDFDLLKESPVLNNIKPIVGEDKMIKSDVSSILPNKSINSSSEEIVLSVKEGANESENENVKINENCNIVKDVKSKFKVGDLIWGVARGCDAWPGKIVNGPDNEPISSNCVWVKWFNANGRQNTEMVQCSTLKSLSDGLEAHHIARKETRKGRKLNLHLERAIQKAMIELDKQPLEENSIRIHNNIKSKSEKICKTSIKTSKSKLLKIAPALSKRIEKY